MFVSWGTAVHDAEQRKPAHQTLPCLSVVRQLNVITILTTHTDNWEKRLEFLNNQRGPIHWRDWTAYIFYSWQPASKVRKTGGQYSTADNPTRKVRKTGGQYSTADNPTRKVWKTGGLYYTVDNPTSKLFWKTGGLYPIADNQPARSERLVDCILQLTTQPARSGRLVDSILLLTTQPTRSGRLVDCILQLTTEPERAKRHLCPCGSATRSSSRHYSCHFKRQSQGMI